MILLPWLSAQDDENLVCHSRAMTSNVSVSWVSAAFCAFFVSPGSMPLLHQSPCIVTFLPGFGKRSLGVCADGQQLLDTPQTILQPPKLAASRSDQEKAPRRQTASETFQPA